MIWKYKNEKEIGKLEWLPGFPRRALEFDDNGFKIATGTFVMHLNSLGKP